MALNILESKTCYARSQYLKTSYKISLPNLCPSRKEIRTNA